MDLNKVRRQFDAAVKVIQGLPKDGSFKPSHELMLKFYAYYKQATVGKCTASKPGFWDVVGKAKWDAWSRLGSMSAEDAMSGYVQELTQIVEMMPQTDEVSHLVKELDEFQEMIKVPPEEVADSDSSETITLTLDQPISNGHIPSSSSSRTSNDSHLESVETLPSHNTDSAAPDLLSGEHSELSHTRSISESTGSEESETDSEEYMDSSDIVTATPNNPNFTKEKTVDLLAGCPDPLTEQPNHSTAQQSPASSSIHSAHSSLHQNSTRPKQVDAHRPTTVTFQLPGQMAGSGEMKSPTSTDVVNEKLRMALLNMQQEISSLEKRLNLVEQITVNERRKQLERGHRFMKWWPFPDLHPRTFAFLILWPVFVTWFMTYLNSRRRR